MIAYGDLVEVGDYKGFPVPCEAKRLTGGAGVHGVRNNRFKIFNSTNFSFQTTCNYTGKESSQSRKCSMLKINICFAEKYYFVFVLDPKGLTDPPF